MADKIEVQKDFFGNIKGATVTHEGWFGTTQEHVGAHQLNIDKGFFGDIKSVTVQPDLFGGPWHTDRFERSDSIFATDPISEKTIGSSGSKSSSVSEGDSSEGYGRYGGSWTGCSGPSSTKTKKGWLARLFGFATDEPQTTTSNLPSRTAHLPRYGGSDAGPGGQNEGTPPPYPPGGGTLVRQRGVPAIAGGPPMYLPGEPPSAPPLEIPVSPGPLSAPPPQTGITVTHGPLLPAYMEDVPIMETGEETQTVTPWPLEIDEETQTKAAWPFTHMADPFLRFSIEVAENPVEVVTHYRPDLDEIIGLWLAEKFGGENFLDEYCWSDERERYELWLGVGGSAFDEHPTRLHDRRRGECCTTLVAKALRTDTILEVKEIISRVLKTTKYAWSIPQIIKSIHSQYPGSPEIAIDWAITALEAIYYSEYTADSNFETVAVDVADYYGETKVRNWEEITFQAMAERERLFLEAESEFQSAQIDEIQDEMGRNLWVATVSSDNEQIHSYARWGKGGAVNVVIVQRSSGHIQIFADRYSQIDLSKVVAIIRLAEQKIKGTVITKDLLMLRHEGKVAGAEEWLFFPGIPGEAHAILNGSPKYPAVPPTNLTLDEVRRAIIGGLEP